ncbi:MAG TPA: hypothetical protein DCZ51_09325 [Bacteroidales bacterium]|nr:hypothetical protein [Bacteroidales bacterium]
MLKAIVIIVKVELNICQLVMSNEKMHKLCRTKLTENGCKDMNLLKRHNNLKLTLFNQKLNIKIR